MPVDRKTLVAKATHQRKLAARPELHKANVLPLTVREFAHRFRVSTDLAGKALVYARYKHLDANPDARRIAKLTYHILKREDAHPGMYEAIAEGVTIRRVATLFGVSKRTVELSKAQLIELSEKKGMDLRTLIKELELDRKRSWKPPQNETPASKTPKKQGAPKKKPAKD